MPNEYGFFEGCKISQPPPEGYKCECEFRCSDTGCPGKICFGSPKKCGKSDVGCNGCDGRECCMGNCKGY